MNFDIAIIGGGPAGYTAAERAGANGLKGVFLLKLCYILLKFWIALRMLPSMACLPNPLPLIYLKL